MNKLMAFASVGGLITLSNPPTSGSVKCKAIVIDNFN